MVEYNRLTIENKRDIDEKAKTKKDGIFSLRGILYRVRDGRATHYASMGKILMNAGGFVVDVGSYRQMMGRDLPKELLRSIKDE